MSRYEIENYKTETGEMPFRRWFDDIHDGKAKTNIIMRLDRAAAGNLGDWKAIQGAKGLFEMRIHYAQGLRIFFTIVGDRIVLLLAGSFKQDQDRAIAKAKQYLADYKRRTRS